MKLEKKMKKLTTTTTQEEEESSPKNPTLEKKKRTRKREQEKPELSSDKEDIIPNQEEEEDEDAEWSESESEEEREEEEESDSSEDEVEDDDEEAAEGSESDSLESEEEEEAVEESDSSEDEVAPRNTIGEDIPLVWYKDEKHIGYDIAAKKIIKQARKDKLSSLIESSDDPKAWRKVYDDYNDEEVTITSSQYKLIKRLLRGKTPHAESNPYQDYVDWFTRKPAKHPISNAPEPKRRFTPSKWEQKKVAKLVRAIRKGLIKLDQPKEESTLYNLWGDDSTSTEKSRHGLSYIAPPKPKLPGHEESYNPSVEYMPTQEEINSYQLMYEEDRPEYIPKKYESVRSIPAYANALKDMFERALKLYLSARIRKKRINIDPETLKPKLPSRKDLRPYPSTCYLEYKGHKGAVVSIAIELSGQWLASGSTDGTVRVWEVETGRCLRIWDVGEAVSYVTWNPVPERRILTVASGHDVFLLNTGLGLEAEQENIKGLLHVEAPQAPDEPGTTASTVNWLQYDKCEGIRLKHPKAVKSVEWHFKGDYFSTVMPTGDSKAILMHQLSKRQTQKILPKVHGIPVSSVFHPSRHIVFVATKKAIRVYDLLTRKLKRKLEPGVREISSIAIHPGGDNLIVGSSEGKLCWFDMDLSTQAYRKLKCHPKDITDVAFHRSYPLFASCSEDSTAYVFHGMVYSDLNQNPLIVPLEILRGHKSTNGRGVLSCIFHPRQPWLFTAGADSVIKLYCH